ncbi:MAG: nucleoside triphosphate pyrophosphohydrolase [Oscillospiraceae bacterium]|nr:nucleoside triphosphate pyrophosphohydrolase [Oscillospiraceae bacterium]
MDFVFKNNYDISDLIEIVKILRSENGCPWDKVQTHESIRSDLIEETYEVCEGIDRDSPEMLREELGDLLLQIVFHAQIESEKNNFVFNDVCSDICKKLIERHPHVFGSVKAETADEVLKNWDAIKKETKKQESYSDTLESIPSTFPALIKGDKICRRASRAGICEKDPAEALRALSKELSRLADEAEKNADNTDGDKNELYQSMMGVILLKICEVDRLLKVDSEKALTYASQRFTAEFRKAEEEISANKRELDKLSEDELRGVKNRIFSGTAAIR